MRARGIGQSVITVLLFSAVGLIFPVPAHPAGGTVRVRSQTVTTTLQTFARVDPIALVRLKALQTGVLNGFRILPGQQVKAGELLGRLGGTSAEALLAQRRSAVARARAEQSAADKIQGLEREKEAQHLSTRKKVYQAEAALAASRARLTEARARLLAAQNSLTLHAPASGTVLTVAAAAGEMVSPGQTILVLQPAGGLWLRAIFYGADASAVRVGMSGRFLPASGDAAIPVRVTTLIGSSPPGGGLSVGLTATGTAPGWRSDEGGKLTLTGSKRTLVAVPSRALILSAGHWWVLVRTPKGDQRRQVVPGPSRGTSTLIEHGLAPGSEVVVENAYLQFHRDFSRHYQPPD